MSGRVPCSPHAVSFGLGSRSVARGGEQATTTHGTLGSSSSSARHRRRRAPCAAASASVTRSPSPSPVKDKPAEAGAVWGSFYCKPLRQRRASSHPLSAGAAASEPSPRLRLLSGLLLVPTDRIEWMVRAQRCLRSLSITSSTALSSTVQAQKITVNERASHSRYSSHLADGQGAAPTRLLHQRARGGTRLSQGAPAGVHPEPANHHHARAKATP